MTMRHDLFATVMALLPLLCEARSEQVTSSVGPDAIIGNPGAKELTPAQLAAMLSSPTVSVFDRNEPDMHAEAHVPGAKPMVYDEVTADKLPTDRNTTIVFSCYSPECPAAATAARTALALGFRDVYCMTAGITGWQDAGLKTEP